MTPIVILSTRFTKTNLLISFWESLGYTLKIDYLNAQKALPLLKAAIQIKNNVHPNDCCLVQYGEARRFLSKVEPKTQSQILRGMFGEDAKFFHLEHESVNGACWDYVIQWQKTHPPEQDPPYSYYEILMLLRDNVSRHWEPEVLNILLAVSIDFQSLINSDLETISRIKSHLGIDSETEIKINPVVNHFVTSYFKQFCIDFKARNTGLDPTKATNEQIKSAI